MTGTKMLAKNESGGAYFYYFDSPQYGEYIRWAGSLEEAPVVHPDEEIYAYSHGGSLYRSAMNRIARFKATGE